MPPLNKFTTKAKDAIKKAHELAIERGQNHVSALHLLAALLLQEESMVNSILDRLEVDTMLLTDSVLESIELPETRSTLSPAYQIYLNSDFAYFVFNNLVISLSLRGFPLHFNEGLKTHPNPPEAITFPPLILLIIISIKL